jgi:hypothetical protein
MLREVRHATMSSIRPIMQLVPGSCAKDMALRICHLPANPFLSPGLKNLTD